MSPTTTTTSQVRSTKTPSRSAQVLKNVKKRDGTVVKWDDFKIVTAIRKAMESAHEGDMEKDPPKLINEVKKALSTKYSTDEPIYIERIQDEVEEALILGDFARTAKAYILYRQRRLEVRSRQQNVPVRIRDLAEESKQYFRNPLSEFVYYRTYSRWIDEEGRRETWVETANRYIEFMRETVGYAETVRIRRVATGNSKARSNAIYAFGVECW